MFDEEFKGVDPKKYETKNYVEHAALVAMARINLIEKRLQAIEFAAYSSRRYESYQNLYPGELRAHLYREKCAAYESLFMFALIGDNKKIQKKAMEMASEAFLCQGRAIMGYLNIEGDFSGSYFTTDENEFRADISEALIKKGLDPIAQTADCPECRARRGQSCRNKKFNRIKSHKKRGLAALKFAVNPQER